MYRVVNLCVAVTSGNRDNLDKIAVAAAFHDLGIWTDHTFDYIAPSVSLAHEHLAVHARADWIPEIEAMIANHHKITRARSHPDWLVEAFRQADWIDVSPQTLASFGTRLELGFSSDLSLLCSYCG